MSTGMARTTLTRPADLLAQVDRAVREGRARNHHDFVATALQRQCAADERAAIDAAFAAMAADTDYQTEALELANEFDAADAEVLRLGEGRQ